MKTLPKRKTAMRWPAYFRLQAKTCLHLAGKATEQWVIASLTERAAEFLELAERAELSPAQAYRIGRR
jgi:hypothetical protein